MHAIPIIVELQISRIIASLDEWYQSVSKFLIVAPLT